MVKINVKIVSLVFIILPCIIYGQACIVTSAQTSAFNLAPGAKAPWNNSKADVLPQHFEQRNSNRFIVYKVVDGKILFKTSMVEIASSISLFSVNGKRIATMNLTNNKTNGEFNIKLANGIYYARLEVNGNYASAFRILVGR